MDLDVATSSSKIALALATPLHQMYHLATPLHQMYYLATPLHKMIYLHLALIALTKLNYGCLCLENTLSKLFLAICCNLNYSV